MSEDDDLVWSSDGGRIRQKPEAKRSPNRKDGIVRISRQTKGRRGKTVTVVTGLDMSAADLSETAGELKKRCGVGGSAKDGVITIQGDQRERVAAELRGKGFEVKLAGG